jgi:hypothetical protein
MKAEDIKQGQFYRAKKPVKVSDGGYNDRAILWVSTDFSKIQYDSPTIGQGRHYPTIPMEKFLSWAGKEITKDEYLCFSQEPTEEKK